MQLTERQINYCMECGVCTGSCPISQEKDSFSPRQIIKKFSGNENSVAGSKDVWSCLTCARCSQRCPVGIDFPEFIRSHRSKARTQKNFPQESHHGIFQSIAQLQTQDIHQNRAWWAEDAGSFGQTGDFFYFVGCIPYFNAAFRYLDLDSLDSSKSILRLLNKIGIKPVISNNECCCGHDALWSGKESVFQTLAKRNLEAIKASGAHTVLFSCPEGYITFKNHYPDYVGELPFKVEHISEFLAGYLQESKMEFKPSSKGTITYHDPCRLGRWAGIYESPRQLLKSVPDLSFKEMDRNRENALCCGTNAWMECTACSKAMQIERLQEALQTGAKTLITSCPKCQIHLTCAKKNTELDIEVTDLYSYLAKQIND